MTVCVLLLACAFSGCIGSDDPANDENNTNNTNNTTYNASTTVTVSKNGLGIGADEIIQIVLPENRAKNYRWEVVPEDGLNIAESESGNLREDENANPVKIFNITADEEGSYVFTALYKHASREVLTYTFTQRLDYTVPTGNTSADPNLVLTIEGIPTPKAGGIVEIKTRGNPTTGYTWAAQMSENGMLRLLDSKYVEDEHEEGMTGVGGTYVWYVTSDVAGTYLFDAAEFSPSGNMTGKFYFDITFI
ncbi:protease inhibitor I42 family protein [Methanimicrococcus hacksteinii]|uniref:protease inhibitor I42 family protein n=1 Tax=Methanimicrococcus hacksteinii TaxID=3028293 RepID=UPI00298F0D7A|nr:protease inhibitor I42 family protein [Methanimicrococcus sp. At1]